MDWSGAGFSGANFRFEITGGRWTEKLALTLPGVPEGLMRSSDITDAAQLDGLSPSASGEIRSKEAERPSAPVGHGALSWYLTASTTRPRGSESSIRLPLWLRCCWNTPATGAS